MRVLSLLLCVGAVLAVERFDGYKVLRFVPYSEEDVITLGLMKANFEDKMQIWREGVDLGDPTDIMVSPEMYQYLEMWADELDIEIDVMIDDVQWLIDNENDVEQEEDSQYLETYLRFDEIIDYMNARAGECSGSLNCDVVEFGTSYESRAMTAIELTTGGSVRRPGIILECGIHAREWISPAVCLNIVNRLINEYSSGGEATRMLDNFDWYIIPSSNPDGYEFTHTSNRMWRKTRQPYNNCFGADPNRNFDYEFGGAGTSNNPCSDIYRGPSAFSESETAAIRDYVNGILGRQGVRAYYSVHSYGQYFLIPWSYAGNTYPPDFSDMVDVYEGGAAAIQSQSGLNYRVGQSADLLGATAGCSDDWAKGSLDIKFAVTLELRDTGTFGFILPATQIQPNFEEVWASFIDMTQNFQDNFPGPN